MSEKSWTIGSSTGGHFPSLEPLFFSNRAEVAIPTALSLKIYQLSTKQVTAKIPLDCRAVSQILLTKDEQSVFVVHENGQVHLVGLGGEGQTELVPLAKKIIKIVSVDEKNNLLALYSTENGIALGSVHANSSKEFFTTAKTDQIGISNNGEFFAFAHSAHVDTFHMSSKTSTKLARTRPTSSIAVSNKGLVAVGSPAGVIDIYYAEGVRSLKWHLEPVRALHFTLGDAYLISGGEERVLVFWQMDADKQQFLPRLDGSVTTIKSNASSTMYAVTLDNAQVLLLSATDLLSRLSVSGVRTHYANAVLSSEKEKKRRRKHANEPVSDYSTIYRIHPGTRNACFVVPQKNGRPGCQVQVYNPVKDEQESVVNIAPSVPVGKVRSEIQISDPSITQLEFSNDGKWMLTVDESSSAGVDKLESSYDVATTLKFWQFDAGWTLVATIIEPHSTRVAAACPHPTENAFLTASNTGELKLWKFDKKWALRRTLKGFNISSKAVSLAWSHDGSALAVAHDQSVQVVSAASLKPVSTLDNIVGSEIFSIAFSGKFIIILGKKRLVVWDLVLAQQSWSIAVQSAHGRLLAVNKGNLGLAVNYLDSGYRVHSRVVLLDVASPIPLAAVSHAAAVSAIVPFGNGFSFVDVQGVISSIGGAFSAPKATSKQQDKVVLYSGLAESDDMVDEEQTTKRLGINSFDGVWDDAASLETLFDRVMKVVG